MSTIAEKLQYLNATKTAIKEAIVEKGVEVADTDTFRSYADKIRSISSGGSSYKIAPTSLSFQNRSDVTDLSFLSDILDTSNMVLFGFMFQNCKNLEAVGTSGWDTSNCTNMSGMFQNCSKLTTLDVSGFDTSKCTNMSGMFQNCSKLTTLDVSGFDTSKCTNMGNMFNGCSGLTTLDVSGFDTSAVVDVRYMFYGCSGLTTLDVSGFDTSKCTRIDWMFYNCNKLTSIDMSGWDASKVIEPINIVTGCSSLTSLIGDHTLEEVEAGTVVALSGLKIRVGFSGTKLERASLLAVIKGLADLTGGTAQTLTLGSTLKAKLTSEDIKIATDKGWTVS